MDCSGKFFNDCGLGDLGIDWAGKLEVDESISYDSDNVDDENELMDELEYVGDDQGLEWSEDEGDDEGGGDGGGSDIDRAANSEDGILLASSVKFSDYSLFGKYISHAASISSKL